MQRIDNLFITVWLRKKSTSRRGVRILQIKVPRCDDMTQRNVNSAFDLAQSLVGAKNVSEMVALQTATAYWQKLLSTMTSQAEEVRALMTKVAVTTSEPVTEQVRRGVDELT